MVLGTGGPGRPAPRVGPTGMFPKFSMAASMVHTWAYFGVYVCTIVILGPFGFALWRLLRGAVRMRLPLYLT